MNKDKDQAKEQYEKLSRKLYNAQIDFKNEIENKIKEKQKQIQDLERGHRNQLQKIQSNRNAENAMKNEEMRNLTSAFETETKRLNQLVNVKDRMIQDTNKNVNK